MSWKCKDQDETIKYEKNDNVPSHQVHMFLLSEEVASDARRAH